MKKLEKREESGDTNDRLQDTLRLIQKTIKEKIAYAVSGGVNATKLSNEVQHYQKQNEQDQIMFDLRDSLQRIEHELTQSRVFETALETAELDLHRVNGKPEKEHESLRNLLWQAAKLCTRRVKTGWNRIVSLAWKGKNNKGKK